MLHPAISMKYALSNVAVGSAAALLPSHCLWFFFPPSTVPRVYLNETPRSDISCVPTVICDTRQY